MDSQSKNKNKLLMERRQRRRRLGSRTPEMSRSALLRDIFSKIESVEYQQTYRNSSYRRMKTEMIKDMREIVDIVRDKLEGGRRLNFLLSDFIHMTDRALTHTIAIEMKHISSWIKEIKLRMLKLGANDEAETAELSNMRSSKNDEDVVGLEKDVEMLLRTTIIGRPTLISTFLIKGMSGTGKTTLAREIYNHPKVVERFECRAWVCFSTELTIKEVLIQLVQQMVVVDGEKLHTSSSLEKMDNQSLLEMLYQHLEEKLYLIVLDDLPKQMHTRSIIHDLPGPYDGSKVLVTSHTSNLTIYLDKYDVHHMKPLDSNESWQLFCKTINRGNKLTGEHRFPKSLERKGKDMLRKCAGLPLAIKEVGKQLADKKVSGGSEWEQLLDSVDFGSTLKLLDLFYQKLDPTMESRFLYLAFFKENTTLRAKKLEHIWNAGGAVSYGKDLQALIDDSVLDVMHKSTEYRMNALLHMLFIQKAEEKIGLEILRSSGNEQPSQSPRHRIIKCSREKFDYSTDQDKNLVSLFFHGGGYLDASPSYWKSFEKLKILDLEDFGLKILPESIGTLMELRYLGLRNNYIKKLPKSLRCLKKLEVLDIAQNFMVEVPDVVWEMESLLHLHMSDVVFEKPLKIDTIKHLKTLTYVSVDNWTYELSSFKMLTYLNKLGIEELDGDSDVSKLFVLFADSWRLTYLILRGYSFRSMPCLDKIGIMQRLETLKLYGLLPRLPNNLPPNIEYLKLVDSSLDEDPMPLLEKLPKLSELKLRNAYIGQKMVILHAGFPKLRVLCIKELQNLRNLQLEKGAMRDLEKIEIYNCPYLDTLPEAIRSLDSLKELKMVTTKKIATKITNSHSFSKIRIVSISP